MDNFEEKFKIDKDIFLYVENKANEMAENFTKIEIQISVILLSFISAGIFSNEKISEVEPNVKSCLLIGYILLFISLFFGLLNSHLKQGFYRKYSNIFQLIIQKYLDSDLDEKEKAICIRGIKETMSDQVCSPSLVWVLQTVMLLLGFIAISIASCLLIKV